MSKKPWGTIVPAPFPLGHQILSNREIDNVVQRLHSSKQCTRCASPIFTYHSKRSKVLDSGGLSQLLGRLTLNSKEKAPDRKRIAEGKILQMGVVNSYAWKGWN
ncbi:hypothetical protein GDO81_009683 [Engystomops pustulosus]|uniref:Uncharacterized protein n=1 Tax=Engystomops pustulosus TaxID=76066 RepID=A0AAV7BT53_ENGPU|nr:hypothetical protein GDO81_009683 [Engystomops pustulosus]